MLLECTDGLVLRYNVGLKLKYIDGEVLGSTVGVSYGFIVY